MQAKKGDRIVARGRKVGSAERHGKVLESRGPQGPYVVRWDGDSQDHLIFPGSDIAVERKPSTRS